MRSSTKRNLLMLALGVIVGLTDLIIQYIDPFYLVMAVGVAAFAVGRIED